jgi:hypothetical protein
MQEDAKWKPVRRQIRHWKAVATQVVLNEVRMFQLDWNEHLLLTDGKAGYDFYGDDDDDDDYIPTVIAQAAGNKDKPKQNRAKSVLFKMVKPFLRVGGRRRTRRQKREAAAQSAAADTDSYVPPIV